MATTQEKQQYAALQLRAQGSMKRLISRTESRRTTLSRQRSVRDLSSVKTPLSPVMNQPGVAPDVAMHIAEADLSKAHVQVGATKAAPPAPQTPSGNKEAPVFPAKKIYVAQGGKQQGSREA